MLKTLFRNLIFAGFAAFISSAQASVVPDYATNNYQNHELSRTEKKCIEEGYKITYANCSNQTAPADRCPHHDGYYRSCSQEQWCRNNNYRFLEADCKSPLYPVKMCDNKFPLYRVCQENVIKACRDSGFQSKDECKLSDKKCPHSPDFGICCGKCEDFRYPINEIPEGYVAVGETCTTCDDVVMTNVEPAACDGFQECLYGPASKQSVRCLRGPKVLYSECKTTEDVCREKGFTQSSCSEMEDTADCPEHEQLKRCTTNCYKQAQASDPNADIIATDRVNPILDLTKNNMRSLVGLSHPDCQNQTRPTVELTINKKNMEQYQHIFERNIENIIFKLNFEEPISLTANGKFNNVKFVASGNLPACPLMSNKTTVSGTVNFIGIPALCMSFDIQNESKLITDGSIKGNIDMGKDSQLGIKGDLNGYLRAQSYSEIFIKGALSYTDPENSDLESASILFGCNNKVKIIGGIFADTASIVVKPWTTMDVSKIELKSTSNSIKLPNTLSSLHLHKYVKLFSSYGDKDSMVVFPLIENDAANECEDKYYIHLGSSSDIVEQTVSFEPANLLDGKWSCRKLPDNQQRCN